MENPPLVSVIVCAYNAEQYIDESISSIINQSYENLEIIVINDGSTDLTLSHLEEISKLDKRIKIISNKYNLGFINSLNIGLGCLANYPEALVKYRLHGNQTSSVYNHKQNEVAKKIKRENITYYLNKIGIDIKVINSVSLLEIYHVDKSNKVLKSILYEMYMSLDKYTITSLLHFIKYHLELFDLKQNLKI
ncbi:TPA: glycosyltransferase family 2 protein, partial [Haemophilus influenzae]